MHVCSVSGCLEDGRAYLAVSGEDAFGGFGPLNLRKKGIAQALGVDADVSRLFRLGLARRIERES